MKKKVWKKILAVVLVLCLLGGTGLGYLAAIHQPEAKIIDRLAATGAMVMAPPLKIVGGSGSPVRVLALVEH